MRAIQKVTSGELLTKQAMRTNFIIYKKNMYVLKLHLNIVTAGIESLVISGNNFLYAFVKEVCYLWAGPRFDTFHQLIIVEALWLQPVLQVGKWV
jgi:hypothetical protein